MASVTHEEEIVTFEASRPYLPLPAKLIVFLSGRGSNFEALARACTDGVIPGNIELAVSDRAGAAGIAKAEKLGVRTLTVERRRGESREAHEERILEAAGPTGDTLICLAGYMRLLSEQFVDAFRLRILNIHPSLLPAFPGMDAQEQAIAYGCKVTGVTVHFVDKGLDSGPIVCQEALEIRPGESAEELSVRLLEVEHRVYALAVQKVLAGGWRQSGRLVHLP